MDWSWAVEGVTEETPRTTGPECINYMTNFRRWTEAFILTIIFLLIVRWAVKRLDPIILPPSKELDKPHSAIRLMLLIIMTFIFGIEMGFKLAGKSVIFVMNPCHIQTVVQIYLLASKPSKTTIALFRIQMNNLNGPVLAFVFPEVECRTYPFEQATYWIQHAMLYIIPVYILKSGAYKMENFNDFNWVIIGVMIMLLYHFVILNALSILTGINLNHMLCAAVADPFQGQNYRIAAVIHESILCPILNKMTVLLFNKYNNNNNEKPKTKPLELRVINRSNQTDDNYHAMLYHQQLQHHITPTEMSLASELAAAAAATATNEDATLRLRHIRQHSYAPTIMSTILNDHNKTTTISDDHDIDNDIDMLLEQELNIENINEATTITAEYNMPTTKID